MAMATIYDTKRAAIDTNRVYNENGFLTGIYLLRNKNINNCIIM